MLVVGMTAHGARGGEECARTYAGYDCSSRFPLPVYSYILQRYLAHVNHPSALVCTLTPHKEDLRMTSYTCLSKCYASPTSVLTCFPLHSVDNLLQRPAFCTWKLLYCGMQHLLIWQIGDNVFEEMVASICRVLLS
jgi:hypothetical protein